MIPRFHLLVVSLLMSTTPWLHAGVRDFTEAHCLDCHDSTTHKAGLDLEKLEASVAAKNSGAVWERIFDRVANHEMPPKKKLQPSGEERAAFLAELANALRTASLARQETDGRSPVRRLTRAEYETTVNDLLHMRTNLRSSFPEDAVTAGFDKVGEGLTLSGAHFAAYQIAAEKALNLAIERGAVIQTDEDGSSVFNHMPKEFAAFGGQLEGSAMVIPSRMLYPNRSVFSPVAQRSGRYRITFTAQSRNNGGKPLPFALGIHDSRFPKPGDAPDTRAWFDIPEDQPRTVSIELDLDAREQVHFFGPSLESGLKVNSLVKKGEKWTGRELLLNRMKVEGPLQEDGGLDEWPGKGYRELFDDLTPQPLSKISNTPPERGKPEPWFPVSAAPKEDAARLLRRFLPKAFRRPVPEPIAADFVSMAHEALDRGVPFYRAMLDCYGAILCSPHFLLLEEKPGALDDYAIASRLSYFLWNSAPDAVLLAAAERGELSTPGGRAAQVERMLEDRRAERFERSFVDQWLDLKNLNATTPDGVLYAEILPSMTVAAEQETRRFFHDLLAEDLSVLECIQSDWTYANELLSALYDLPDESGYELRKISLTPQSRRGGLLTQASILKVTADGANTSPILRGKWVNERILGIIPPNPPEDVPKIEPDIRGTTTIREQLAKHRNTPACMSCHTVIDPPGFALETFDVIGGWRDFYRMPKSTGAFVTLTRFGGRRVHRGPAVESGYSMPDGRVFADITAYKMLLLEDKERIVSALAANLLTYATGAPVQFADREDIAALVAQTRAKNFGFRSLVHALVQSRPFLHK
jgi:hypothetical protein